MQPTPTPTEILYTIYFHDKHHRWHTSNSYLFLLDCATVPFPFSLPLLSLTYITRQQTSIAASRLATRPGDARSAALFWGEALPKIHTVCLSIPPAQNTYGGGPTLPYPQPH